MGTAAGFFGLTYQGAVNGLASNTLSIFNMDHPNDRAWLKLSFDFVAPDDKLRSDQVTDLLQYFYKGRAEGPTQSGSYVHSYPENEATMLRGLCTEAGDSLSFMQLLDALQGAQANFAEPTAPLEYSSNSVMRNDLLKHTRKLYEPQQQFRQPLTTAQEVRVAPLPPSPLLPPLQSPARAQTSRMLTALPSARSQVGWALSKDQCPGRPFHLRTSATTQFSDAMEKQAWGRSIGGEFSAFATKKLLEFGGFGMGV